MHSCHRNLRCFTAHHHRLAPFSDLVACSLREPFHASSCSESQPLGLATSNLAAMLAVLAVGGGGAESPPSRAQWRQRSSAGWRRRLGVCAQYRVRRLTPRSPAWSSPCRLGACVLGVGCAFSGDWSRACARFVFGAGWRAWRGGGGAWAGGLGLAFAASEIMCVCVCVLMRSPSLDAGES